MDVRPRLNHDSAIPAHKPITALSQPVAVKEAIDFVEGLFLVRTVQKVVGHLQGPDGTVLQQIDVSREREGGPFKATGS